MFDIAPMDKIGVTNTRLTNLEYLGADMIEAGNEFSSGTPYGSALIRVGQTEQGKKNLKWQLHILPNHFPFAQVLTGIQLGQRDFNSTIQKLLETDSWEFPL